MKIKRVHRKAVQHQQTPDGVSFYDEVDGSKEPSVAVFMTPEEFESMGRPAYLNVTVAVPGTDDAPEDATYASDFAGEQVDNPYEMGLSPVDYVAPEAVVETAPGPGIRLL